MLEIQNIKYQILEKKYQQAAVDCLNQVRNQAGSSNSDLEVSQIVINDESHIFQQYPESCFTTIIALDTSKEDYVCGILPGIDFTNYTQLLRKQNTHSLINEKNQIFLKLLEPLIALNFCKGEVLVGINFGVRLGYEDLKIGQNLVKYFIANAQALGYSMTSGIAYNPKSAYVISKQNHQCFNYIDIRKMELSEEAKRKFKNKHIFFLGRLIQKNIPQTKIPEIIQPSL
ncbi:hypothetical protein ABPG74_000220 [Tetrahymena malaccensis]